MARQRKSDPVEALLDLLIEEDAALNAGERKRLWVEGTTLDGKDVRKGVLLPLGDVAPLLASNSRVGSARDGWVTAFIPDPEPDPDNSGTSGAEGVAVDARVRSLRPQPLLRQG